MGKKGEDDGVPPWEASEYALCVASGHSGSERAVAAYYQRPELQSVMRVVDMPRALTVYPRPPWFRGVPMIRNNLSGEVFMGPDCFEFLRMVSVREAAPAPTAAVRGRGQTRLMAADRSIWDDGKGVIDTVSSR